MLQVHAEPDYEVLLCGRRNTCNGDKAQKILRPKQLCGFLIFATLLEVFLNPFHAKAQKKNHLQKASGCFSLVSLSIVLLVNCYFI